MSQYNAWENDFWGVWIGSIAHAWVQNDALHVAGRFDIIPPKHCTNISLSYGVGTTSFRCDLVSPDWPEENYPLDVVVMRK